MCINYKNLTKLLNVLPVPFLHLPKSEVIIAPVPDEINCCAGVIPKTFCWDADCKTGTAVVTFNLPSSFLLIKSLLLVITSTTREDFVELGKVTLFVNSVATRGKASLRWQNYTTTSKQSTGQKT